MTDELTDDEMLAHLIRLQDGASRPNAEVLQWAHDEIERLRAHLAVARHDLQELDAYRSATVEASGKERLALLLSENKQLRGHNEKVTEEAGSLVRIINAAANLLLAGAEPTDLAHRLHAAVEGEHRLVLHDGEQVVWPELNMADVAAQLEREAAYDE